jgi:hypothetical protein
MIYFFKADGNKERDLIYLLAVKFLLIDLTIGRPDDGLKIGRNW